MPRHQLTDEDGALIADVFPPRAATGRKPTDRRRIVDGILWILNTGSPWRDLPEEYGPWKTVWDLFDTWNENGTLDEILRRRRASTRAMSIKNCGTLMARSFAPRGALQEEVKKILTSLTTTL